MGTIKEVFDVKHHPQRDGESNDLEKRVEAIERRFAELYTKERVGGFSGFQTEQGTRFYVNAIYEWNTVFLEYDDGEDGDMIPLEYDEEKMFQELNGEILICELDDRKNLEKTYRIFKVKKNGNSSTICFRFPDGRSGLHRLFSESSKVEIEGKEYCYEAQPEHQSIVVEQTFEDDLYDHWIKFLK